MMRTFALALLFTIALVNASSIRGADKDHRDLMALNSLCTALTLEQWVLIAAFNTDMTADQAEQHYLTQCNGGDQGVVREEVWEHNCADPLDVTVWKTFLKDSNPAALECESTDDCPSPQFCSFSSAMASCTKIPGDGLQPECGTRKPFINNGNIAGDPATTTAP